MELEPHCLQAYNLHQIASGIGKEKYTVDIMKATVLKLPDELLVELAESKVRYFEPAADEVSETVVGIEVIGEVYGETH